MIEFTTIDNTRISLERHAINGFYEPKIHFDEEGNQFCYTDDGKYKIPVHTVIWFCNTCLRIKDSYDDIKEIIENNDMEQRFGLTNDD